MASGKEATVLTINRAWCKGCGICAAFCPRKVLAIKKEKVEIVDGDACVKCGLCEQRCPDYAIFLASGEEALK